MISTNQLELFSTVRTTVPTTAKLLKLTESFSNSETFSNKSVNVSILRYFSALVKSIWLNYACSKTDNSGFHM